MYLRDSIGKNIGFELSEQVEVDLQGHPMLIKESSTKEAVGTIKVSFLL